MAEAKKVNLPLVVIFGRTNVGKSALFNCLVEKQQALVSNIEGTTRDSNISTIEWRGVSFRIVDTGGIIDTKVLIKKKKKFNEIDDKVQKQASDYLDQADLILFLVDSKTGILPQDSELAQYFKKKFKKGLKKILLIANKADSISQDFNLAEFNKLSLGEPIPISAANGSRVGDMLDLVVDRLARNLGKKLKEEESGRKKEKIKVCLIGKPNVGKSSLLNSLLGYPRVIVSPTPHTTREPQNTEISYQGKKIILIDTAGISRKGKKTKGLEKYGIEKSLAALKKSDIALLVLDISRTITHQDMKLVEEIIKRGKSFLIIANKWDLIKEKDRKKYLNYIYARFPFAFWAPVHFTSALTGSKINKVLDFVLEAALARKKELSESSLSRFLKKVIKIHPPARGRGIRKPRIFKLKQTGVSPPAFEVKIGSKEDLDSSYLRFIENRLREKFDFFAAPISVYVKRKKRAHGSHKE